MTTLLLLIEVEKSPIIEPSQRHPDLPGTLCVVEMLVTSVVSALVIKETTKVVMATGVNVVITHVEGISKEVDVPAASFGLVVVVACGAGSGFPKERHRKISDRTNE